MILSWFQQQQNHRYWLVDRKLHKQALQQNGGFGFEEAVPLFYGAMFTEVMPLSPWLIPVSESVLLLPEALLEQGIGLSSHAEGDEVLNHLRSLLIAGLEGEEVMFRFYDRSVIIPMLARMDQSEVNQFLGNVNQLASLDDGDQGHLVTFDNTSHAPFNVQQGSWWVIKAHHLDKQENLPLLKTNLESWLWQHFPKAMDKHLTQGRDIASMFTPFLSAAEQTLTYRVMSAAIATIMGNEYLAQPSMIELLKDHQNEEIQYALHSLARQLQHEG
ncbi:DUF4123 domain-containing protein [Vibrio sp. 1180_3]|uniref:DUF4123 domain-containing protein n=1 Tax=Vibrio sp. 1180_3 TaxID=2528832 RepID=UPI0024063C49|nr:DUF4123 domain-containing protein [Vibrio sp. 1180_3]